MARSISKCKCLNSGAFADSGCSLQNSRQLHTNSANSNLSYSTVPIEEKRKLCGNEAPVFFLEQSWSSEGKLATSNGRPGEEAAVGAMANCNFFKVNGGVVETASETGEGILTLSWANFSCVSVI